MMPDRPRLAWFMAMARVLAATIAVALQTSLTQTMLCGTAYGANNQDKIPVLKLEQESSSFGALTVYVSASAVKAICTKKGFSVLSSAPTWDVLVLNPAAKTARSVSYKQWVSSYMLTGPAKLHPPVPILPSAIKSVTQFHGLRCTQYVQPADESEYGTYGSMLTGYRYADDGTERTSYLLVETLPPGSKQVANVLTHFLNSTSMGGIPITSGFRHSSGLSWKLRTKRWSRELLSKQFFARPTGYKQLNSFEQVIYSTSTIKEAEDVMDQMKFGEYGK